MTTDEQLKLWVTGQSIHRGKRSDPRSECCPDFSCCKPELLAPESERREFVEHPEKRNDMCGTFLGRLIAREFPRGNIEVLRP